MILTRRKLAGINNLVSLLDHRLLGVLGKW
jgi:hypothetical protein